MVRDAGVLARANQAWDATRPQAKMQALQARMEPHQQKMEVLGKRMEACTPASSRRRSRAKPGARCRPWPNANATSPSGNALAMQYVRASDAERERLDRQSQQLDAQQEAMSAQMERHSAVLEQQHQRMQGEREDGSRGPRDGSRQQADGGDRQEMETIGKRRSSARPGSPTARYAA